METASTVGATRESALKRLSEFLPKAGKVYSEGRNYDLGPGKCEAVSGLSPYLTHRLLTESEVVQATLAAHKPKDCESFLQEVCWRTYWKGWLEGRPQIYAAWKRLVQESSRHWPEREDFQKAVNGETDIDAFNSWVEELKTTGYLHNHARMWFASIWIFTLKLPWSLGAAFFMEHLLDGDAASNTLSWRWVAGLQTKGKHYVATAENIKKFTKGRFDPAGKLATKPASLQGPPSPGYVPPVNYPFGASDRLGEDFALLLTTEDLSPETGVIGEMKPRQILLLPPKEVEYTAPPSAKLMGFKESAMKDAAARAEKHFGCSSIALELGDDPAAALEKVMKGSELSSLVYYEPFVGDCKATVAKLSSRDVGVKFFPLRRPWDGLLHPHAVKGYFNFKKHALPQILRTKGVLSGSGLKKVGR